MEGGGGTEAFPDLGKHCQHQKCNQLDFLPFRCDSCRKVYCMDHRSHNSHDCPKSDHKNRRVLICDACCQIIEITGCDDGGKDALQRHGINCDPDMKNKNKKAICAARRCRTVLTFANSCVCKICRIRVCLGHRFPSDHACERRSVGFSRKFNDCGKEEQRAGSSASTNPQMLNYVEQ